MSSRPNKKRRFSQVVSVSQRRPVDKLIVYVNQTVSNTTNTTTLTTATFPETITGIRWSLTFRGVTNANNLVWTIVRIKQSIPASAIALSTGTSVQNPEQETIAFGVAAVTIATDAAGPSIMHVEGSTKSMRKLMGGDILAFQCNGNTAAAATDVRGAIQFFGKS